jgi:hypothetical protein
MIPFSIAGIQMNISMERENITAMGHKLDVVMARFPWVQMVVFSELAAFGPAPYHAQPTGGPAEQIFCQMAAKHGLWLLPGSMFERIGDDIYNTTPVIDPNGHGGRPLPQDVPLSALRNGYQARDRFLCLRRPQHRALRCLHLLRHVVSRNDPHAGVDGRRMHSPSDDDRHHRPRCRTADRPRQRNHQPVLLFRCQRCRRLRHRSSIIVGPSGYVIHEAGGGEEIMPVEIDMSRVRREREVGIRGLGQTLKSFRDRPIEFPVYQKHLGHAGDYLNSLGPLIKPTRGTRSEPVALPAGVVAGPDGLHVKVADLKTNIDVAAAETENPAP